MGKKVNPKGLRVLIRRDWDSVWYGERDYADKAVNDVQIREYIKKNYGYCNIGKIGIERTSDKAIVTIKTAKPGVLIGRKGVDIDNIKKNVEKISGTDTIIKIVEVERPDIDAAVVAYNIAKQLENRMSFRKVMKKAIQSAMKYGVAGIKIMCSGRLGGAEIARSESYKEGSIPLHTLRADVDYALAEAITTYGVIGVKVWICKKIEGK